MTIDTNLLRDLIHRASPTPWVLATSNSWRRIVDARDCCVCEPTTQPDGHPDLIFHGGYDGPNARLLIEAVNALPELLQTVDAQAAEIKRLRDVLCWTAGALEALCSEPGARADDLFRIDGEYRTMDQLLDAADTALTQEQSC